MSGWCARFAICGGVVVLILNAATGAELGRSDVVAIVAIFLATQMLRGAPHN